MQQAVISITLPGVPSKILAALALLCSPFIVVMFLVCLAGAFAALGAAFNVVLFLGVHSPVSFLVALFCLGGLIVYKGNCYA